MRVYVGDRITYRTQSGYIRQAKISYFCNMGKYTSIRFYDEFIERIHDCFSVDTWDGFNVRVDQIKEVNGKPIWYYC